MPIRFGKGRVIDPFHTVKRTVAYVSGSARSGTTWLADMLAHAAGARVVFEPLHHRGPIGELPHFLGSDDLPANLAAGIQAALSGRFRHGTVNAFQPGGIYFRRVVKDIRPGLLPAVRTVAPEVPVLHILRHPIEVAVSRMELDTRDNWWDTDAAIAELHGHAEGRGTVAGLASQAVEAISANPDELTRHVAIWCVENAIARACTNRPALLTLRYEDLLIHPDEHIGSIEAFLGLKIDRAILEQPTATSFRGKAGVRRLGKWRQQVDRASAERLLQLTERFELSDLYGVDPDLDLPPA